MCMYCVCVSVCVLEVCYYMGNKGTNNAAQACS